MKFDTIHTEGYYMTMFDKLYCQGRFKVMANFDHDDLMTLKHPRPSLCFEFRLLALLNSLQSAAIFEEKKNVGDLDLDDLCCHKI